MSIEIQTRGLDALEAYFASAPEKAREAAVFAVNDTAQFARRLSSKEIRQEVNWSAGYLLKEDRLAVVRRAYGENLEAVVRGRNRPTSLATFSNQTPTFGSRKRAIKVRVAASGGAKEIKRGFFMRLRSGGQLTEEASNIGLAIRLKPGERIRGKHTTVGIKNGLSLLYGPSVGQVFRTVAQNVSGEVADKLVDEFVRQFGRLTNGR